MEKYEPSREDLAEKIKDLEERLSEAEEINRAIRNGEVDALVVREAGEESVYTLKGADYGYRMLVESMNEGALILAPDDSIYYCNRCMGEMLGLPINRIIGSSLVSYIDGGKREELTELIRESRSCGKARAEFQIRRADGKTMPVNVSLNCVSMENFNAVCAIVTDLTTQKRTEQELRHLTDKLRRSNVDLEDFAFVASHDLQEPLRKIQAFGDILVRSSAGVLDETGKDSLQRMQNAAARMRTLLRDLLALSRLSRIPEPFKILNLKEPVDEAIDALTLTIAKTEGKVEISDLPTVEAIPSQMRQLFQNLISNALKFRGDKPPCVRIFMQPADPGCCRICVEDNGIGFDETYLELIFRPFQRLHGRSEYEGTGMGLAICKKIVERHNGSISAKSKLGEGATFIVILPIDQRGQC